MKKDGGPAFPQPLTMAPQGNLTSPWDGWGIGGMTLRDYFAANAMQVEISTACHSIKNAQALVGAAEEARRTIEQQIAHNAYSMADAMLAEREKP